MKILLVIPCLVACVYGGSRDWRDPNYHTATDEQLVIRQGDGGVRFGVDLGDSFRAEIRDGGGSGGAVRGVYSYLRPDGSPFTLAYAKAPGAGAGYRPVVGGAAALPGVALPAFPRSLYPPRREQRVEEELLEPYGALAARDGVEERVLDEDVVVVEPPKRGYPLPYVRIEPERDSDDVDEELEGVLVGEGEGEPEAVVGGVPISQLDLPFFVPLKPGQSLSESVPAAVAIAGPFGFAQAAPAGAAVVGPHGVSFAAPAAETVAGDGGVAVSNPVASAQAGFGGIAIAAGTASSAAGLNPTGGAPLGQEQVTVIDEEGVERVETVQATPGFVTARLGHHTRPGGGVAIYPIVANYFFGSHPYPMKEDKDQPKTSSYSSYRPKHPSKGQYKPYPVPTATSYSASPFNASPYTASSYEAFTQKRSNAHSY